MELSDRKEKILSAVIERFITTGEPVGSKFIAAALPVAVSSATIRNEMAFLSENGYLDQPHTSAGRVPSDKGYRYYIDKLLQNYAPSDADMFRILSGIDHSEGDSAELLSQVCEMLAELTGCTAVVSSPDPEGAIIKSTQVVPVGKKTAMIVVATSAGVLKSRLARLDSDIDYGLVELFYNTVSANFIGFPADNVTTAKLQTVAASLGQKSLDMMTLLVPFKECVAASSVSSVTVRGQSNLLNIPELRHSAADIIELFDNEDTARRIMRISSDSPVELSIGSENEYGCLKNAAVIKSAYSVGGSRGGTVSVISSTKTDYSRIIPLVKYISGITGVLLTELGDG